MTKVCDLNYLRDPKIEGFFADSSAYGVLFEYHFMEMSKGNAPVNFKNSFTRLLPFRDRIIVCKGVRDLILITGAVPSVTVDHLIDYPATAAFPNFCEQIHTPDFDLSESSQFDIHASDSRAFFELRKRDASRVATYIRDSLRRRLDPDRVKAMRSNKTILPNTRSWLTREASAFAAQTLIEKGYDIPFLENCIAYRFILSGYLLGLHWIAAGGGLDQFPAEKMVNDITDMMYVALSSYFDGLLSNEKKMNWISTQLEKTLVHS